MVAPYVCVLIDAMEAGAKCMDDSGQAVTSDDLREMAGSLRSLLAGDEMALAPVRKSV